MTWKNTEKHIQNEQANGNEPQPNTLRNITLNAEQGIKAIIDTAKGKHATEVASYLFEKDKGGVVEKTKEGVEQHCTVLPCAIAEKIMKKPLRIRGLAMTTGMSRNLNIYTAEELQAFAGKLVSAPVYVEHMAVPNAVGKVTEAKWDGQNLWYEAEIYDEETAEKIRKGIIQHVSVGADYEAVDIVDGKIPHGLHNAEISLVAVPGIPAANIQVMEKLHVAEQTLEPMVTGEYILGFHQEASAFLPEHFSTVWLDRENGVLAVMGKLRQQPGAQRTQAIFFAKDKRWDQTKIHDWLSLHPDYVAPVSIQNLSPSSNFAESLLKKPTEPVMPVSKAVQLIESVLPSPLVQRSWSLGPQRMCQELRRVLVRLQSPQESHDLTVSS